MKTPPDDSTKHLPAQAGDGPVSAPAPADSLEEALATLITNHEARLTSVSRALHDDVGQILSAVGLQLDAMRMEFKSQPDLAERTTEIQEILGQAMERVRDLSQELNPSIVERAGLQFALERLVARYRRLFRGSIRLFYDYGAKLPSKSGTAFYRVVEYALKRGSESQDCTEIEAHIRPGDGAIQAEVRLNCRIDQQRDQSDPLLRIELLLLHYHASRAGIPVAVQVVPQRGTIIKATFRTDPEPRSM